MPANTHHISFVLIPRFNMLALMTLIEPMRIAHYQIIGADRSSELAAATAVG